MKISFLTCLMTLVFSSMSLAEDAFDLQEENDRISYSVGYQVGGDFANQELKLNADALLKGIEDAVSGGQPLLTPKEMRATLVDLKKKIVAAQTEQAQATAEENLAEGRAFLAANREKEGVVTLPSGLQYKVLEAGKGLSPKSNDLVTVHYCGMLIDGTEFDSSYHRGEPATFQADHVIKGWREILPMMKPGARYTLFIPPELAYGKRGGGSKIGPNSTLIFDVELLAVQSVKE